MKKEDQKLEKDDSKDLFGIEKDISLQSVNFATHENKYFNEHSQEEEY